MFSRLDSSTAVTSLKQLSTLLSVVFCFCFFFLVFFGVFFVCVCVFFFFFLFCFCFTVNALFMLCLPVCESSVYCYYYYYYYYYYHHLYNIWTQAENMIQSNLNSSNTNISFTMANVSPRNSSNSSRKQIFRDFFLFYHVIVCYVIEAILMKTLNIPLLYRKSKTQISKLSIFASWPGTMINPQWLEQFSMVPKMSEPLKFDCINIYSPTTPSPTHPQFFNY